MFLSIVVYTFTALILYVLAVNVSQRDQIYYSKTGKTLSMGSWEILLSFLVFCFIAGARYNVGVDYLSYLEEYRSLLRTGHFNRDTYEEGFKLISVFFAKVGFHFFFYFAFWAFLQILFIYKSCRDEKYLLPYIALCIMLGPYFLDWMNGIRQCVVMCFFVYAIRFIENKRLLPYVAGIFLFSFLHKSAVLLIPFILLGYRPVVLKNRLVNCLIILFCVFLGLTPTWINLMTNAANLLSVLGYEKYSEGIAELTNIDTFGEMAWGPSRLSLFFTDIIIVCFYPKIREFFAKTKKIDIMFFIFFLGVCLYNAFVNTSHIFLRPIEYFTIMKLPLCAYTLCYLKKSKNIFWFAITCVLLFCYIYFVIYKSVYFPVEGSEVNLYKFYFFEIK